MNYSRSDELRRRAHRAIPGGAHTYSKGDDQFPQLSPGFIVRGSGSRVWDVDGNSFVDWGMGLRSVILGHAHESVVRAVERCLRDGSNFTRPHPMEIEAAELLVETIPSAEMVKFAKNGSDATTAAVRLARAHTGRDIVACCQDHPFFSTSDWFIGTTECSAGVPRQTQWMTKRFRYNDIGTLASLFEEHPDEIACVILEPTCKEEPRDGYLESVRDLCREHGAVLIFDEVITGFRWHPRGAQSYFGVTPDLSTFGKAMANGFAVSALVGRREIMELGGLQHTKPRVFLLSTTHGGEVHSLAAALATIRALNCEDVTEHIWCIGRLLQEGLNDLAVAEGLRDQVHVAGYPCSPVVEIHAAGGITALQLRTLFLQETIKKGVLMPYVAPSYSHTEADVRLTLDACHHALRVLREAIDCGSVEGRLVGETVRPVFRKYNREDGRLDEPTFDAIASA